MTKTDLAERILIFAPIGRDGALLYRLAEAHGLRAETCPDLSSLASEFARGAGAVLMTEEGLTANGMSSLAVAVAGQPAWSDIPFLVLVSSNDADGRIRATAELMRPLRNVTAIERPVRPQTVLVSIEAALRARARQLALRDALEDLEESRARLSESEERYRTLTEAIPQLVWQCRATGECEYLSSQWAEYTGIPTLDLLGYVWLETLHPDDRERTFGAWRNAVEGRAPYDLDYRIRRHDGVYHWFRTRGTAVRDESGSLVRWNGTCTDIQDRIEAEQALELANKVGASLAADLDIDRIVDTLTQASTQATGAQFGAFFYNVVDERGESYMLYNIAGVPRETFSKFPMPRNTPIFAPTFSGESVVRSDDITKDPRYGKMDTYGGMPEGHLPVRSYLAIPVVSRSGEVLGGIFFGHAETGRFTEVHERAVVSFAAQAAIALDNARLYRELRTLNQELEGRVEERTEKLQNAVRELEGFTHSVSHDMRTPLRAMIGNANIILEDFGGEVSDEARGHLERIADAALKMANLVEDLLRYARLGRREVRRDEINLSEMAEAVVSVVREETGHAIEATVQPGLHALGDRELVRMVLHNLVGNAVKYHPHDRPVKIDVGEENGEFFVRDNGIGFDMAYAGKLFVPFERLHRDSEYPGTGIGLANVKRIIERHGGDVRAEGSPGAGSVFRFTIPSA